MKQLTPASPHVIVMVGVPGAGKSTFATSFAKTFSAPFINKTFIEREYDIDSKSASAIARGFLEELLKTNKTIILESQANKRSERASLVKNIKSSGYIPLVVWVQTDVAEAKRRATKKYPSGSGLTPEEFEKAVSNFQPPTDKETVVVISGKHTYTTQLKAVLRHLASERPKFENPPRQTQPATRRTLLQ